MGRAEEREYRFLWGEAWGVENESVRGGWRCRRAAIDGWGFVGSVVWLDVLASSASARWRRSARSSDSRPVMCSALAFRSEVTANS